MHVGVNNKQRWHCQGLTESKQQTGGRALAVVVEGTQTYCDDQMMITQTFSNIVNLYHETSTTSL